MSGYNLFTPPLNHNFYPWSLLVAFWEEIEFKLFVPQNSSCHMKVLVLFLSLLALTASPSQAAVNCVNPGGDKSNFGTCSYQGLGGLGATEPSEACAGNQGDAYNACMCHASSEVVKW
jgi:hypothetical protein